MANVLNLLFGTDGDSASLTLQTYYPTATITHTGDGPGPVPGVIIAVMGTTTLVIISSTSNALQWALQGFSGLIGLYDAGGYSTLFQWLSASNAIVDAINDAGGNVNGKVVLVGHSYGGALASVLATRYRIGNADRNIGLLTFGSPRPGDQRLCDILQTTTQAHLVNDDDWIPFVPPGSPDTDLWGFLIPSGIRNQWLNWKHPGYRIGQRADGTRYEQPQLTTIYAALFNVVVQATMGIQPTAIYAHAISEYYRRCVCPGVAPSPEPPIDFVGTGGGVIGGSAKQGIGSGITGSGGGAIGGIAYQKQGSGITGSGGGAIGGFANQYQIYNITGDGGGAIGGSASQLQKTYIVGIGGGAIGGVAGQGLAPAVVGTGGGAIGGVAEQYSAIRVTGDVFNGANTIQLHSSIGFVGISVAQVVTGIGLPTGTVTTGLPAGFGSVFIAINNNATTSATGTPYDFRL